MLKKMLLLLAVGSVTMFFSGCEAFKEIQYEPSYTLGFLQHVKFPGRSNMIEREITDPTSNKSYWINTNQFFDSSSITEVKMIEIPDKPNYYNLGFKLDRSGANKWTSLCGHSHGSSIIVTIDGEFYCIYKQELKMIDDDEIWVKCDAEFDILTARGIVKYAPQNYKYYKPDVSNWFFQ